jgi:16S rRNA (cytidine1402-2'-O)-methyltransferase
LEDALAEMGDRPAAIGRELTKMHEEVLRGTLSELLEELRKRPSLKGEFVVVVVGSAMRGIPDSFDDLPQPHEK